MGSSFSRLGASGCFNRQSSVQLKRRKSNKWTARRVGVLTGDRKIKMFRKGQTLRQQFLNYGMIINPEVHSTAGPSIKYNRQT